MSTETQAPTSETTFFWPARRKSSWRLAGLIFMMLFAHSAAFFLFQAATPVINPPPRTAPPIQLLSPYGPDGEISAENESLLRWIDAEDPALAARVPNVELPSPVEVPYRPSFETMRTPPLNLPTEPPTVQFPPPRDVLSLIASGMPARQAPRESLPPRATELRFSADLAARLSAPPKFSPRQRSKEIVPTTQFLIGVTAEGETRFVFPQRAESARARALEEEAANFLSSLQFQSAAGIEIQWGTVDVHWGDEIVAEP